MAKIVFRGNDIAKILTGACIHFVDVYEVFIESKDELLSLLAFKNINTATIANKLHGSGIHLPEAIKSLKAELMQKNEVQIQPVIQQKVQPNILRVIQPDFQQPIITG